MQSQQNFNADNFTSSVTKVLLAIYVFVILWILIFKMGVSFAYMKTRSVNLIPFEQPLRSNGKIDTSEMFLNVLIFMPLGVYVGILLKGVRLGTKVLIILICSSIIECIQFFFKIGAFDITDIITNTTGGVIGVWTFILFEKLFSNTVRAQKCINIIGIVGTVVMVSLLILLKINMLPIRYQ